MDVSPGLFPASPAAAAAPPSRPPAAARPEAPAPGDPAAPLHPALWRAHQVARPQDAVCASGFGALDAQLPGGGWPARALTELLLPHPGVGELRLLAPALAAVQRAGRSVMWFDPPASPCGWTLAALGLDLRQLLLIHGRDGPHGPARQRLPAPDVLWALERALKSGHVGAVLAWLPPTVRPESLRRLQLAAQAHDGPAWLIRDSGRATPSGLALALRPSAAPLRLALAAGGPDELCLRILKRRGPPLADVLRLALPPVLSAPARARAQRGAPAPAPAGPGAAVLPAASIAA
ncbi:MAG: translesion DNA synthesis-associated protein ImuA [Rubrivivax sp.]